MKTLILIILGLLALTGCGQYNCVAYTSSTQQYPEVIYQRQSSSPGPAACPWNYIDEVPANQVIKTINN